MPRGGAVEGRYRGALVVVVVVVVMTMMASVGARSMVGDGEQLLPDDVRSGYVDGDQAIFAAKK